MRHLLVILGILILCFELCRLLRGNWIRRFLKKKEGAAQPRKPLVMKPKSERDCPLCVKEKGERKSPEPGMPEPWRLRKGRGGPKKRHSTAGHFCPNPDCDYYRITDESIYALVGYGCHGKQEQIQDLKYQACGKKFTSRKNTILFVPVENTFRAGRENNVVIALGVDASALEEVFRVRKITIRTWLCRSGIQDKKLHERFMLELDLIHVQLDELWANVKRSTQDMWVWKACDVTTKIIPVIQVGGRTQEMAFHIVHELKERLHPGCVPVFRTLG